MPISISKQDRADLAEAKVLLISHVALALFCVLLTLWMASSAIAEVNKMSKDSAMERAGRLYSIIIREQWSSATAIEETLSFLRDSERGVVDVWLVNSLAGVISPLEKAYQILDDSELDKILSQKEVSSEPVVAAQKVYVPIRSDDSLLKGVLILEFSELLGTAGVSGNLNILSSVFFSVLVSLVVAIAAALYVGRSWRALLIQVESDLDGVGDSLQRPSFDTAESTLQKHQFLYYRLLSKVRRN